MSDSPATPQTISFSMNQWKDIYYKNGYLYSKNWFLIHSTDVIPSIFYAEYIDDLPQLEFMINNRINGYLQELMNVNQFSNIAHGRVIIDGKNVRFVWIFVTTDIPNEMVNSTLYPCCKWEKITKNDKLFDTIMFNESDNNFIDYR